MRTVPLAIRLPQRAYLATRYAIRQLELPPGQTVLEREMVDILGMSRTSVREALVRLEMEGWVRLIPRRGHKKIQAHKKG
ncbi:GntR family transcriptional regulator [Neobacillus sp. NRS-1170]|uniref:GntR family transcriptional regulator n=1 Tax=Neobacillus sp. NRS-1170 TaxID=3233898 RepID=UPI003D2D62E4